MSELSITTLSDRAKITGNALVLRKIQEAYIDDREQAQRGVGHGVFLKEQGFYPLGHRAGIIVLSYHDPLMSRVVYEKLVFIRAVAVKDIERERLEDGERLMSFE